MQHDGRKSDLSFATLHSRNPEMLELLADAIAGLPRSERLVFTLYFYEGLTISEIALVVGETPLAVLQLHDCALGGIKARLADAERQAGEAEQRRKPS